MSVVTVELLDYQFESLQDPNQFLLWHGGRGSGKSHTLVQDLYNCCVAFPRGKFALVCNDHVQLRDSTHETLIAYLFEIGCPFKYQKQDKIITLPNGSTIHELTFEKDKTSLKGAEWDGVFVDEGDGKNTTEEKFDYLIDSCRGKIGDRRVRVACNPVPPGHFLAERFFIKPRKNHVGYMVSTYMNADNLPPDYIPNLEAKYGKGSDEWKRWMMGEMVSLSGAVYKSFGPEFIVLPEEIPPAMQAWAYGQDLGVNDPHVLLEGGLGNDGILYITREYYAAGMDIIQHIPYLKSMYREGWPIFSDHSATQHSIMAREGFSMHKAIKDVLPGIQKVQARFTLKGIRISSDCHHLIAALYNYCWKSSPNLAQEAPEHKFSHSCFTGDTEILLADGSAKPIRDVTTDDVVQTPEGPQKVQWSGVTQVNQPILYGTLEGQTLGVTRDHQIFSKVQRQDLHEVQTVLDDGTARRGEIPAQGSLGTSQRTYTSKASRSSLGRGPGQQRYLQSGMSTGIGAPVKTLQHTREQGAYGGDGGQVQAPDEGMARQSRRTGVAQGTREEVLGEQAGVREGVRGVRVEFQNLLPDQSQVLWWDLQSQSPAFKTWKAWSPFERVEDVYCLTVACGWFILANGLVVKNCDALRYLICGIDTRSIFDSGW